MHYYIDGYNLLFRLMHTGENLQNLREKVIQEINQKAGLINLNVSIVFDAPFKLGEGNRSHYDAIEILFTAEGETADEFLLAQLRSCANPQKETIVTSDKKLAWAARHKSAHTVSVEEFIDWLNRRYKNKLNQLKKPLPAPRITKAPPPVPKASEPASKTSVEECVDYYELTFQAKFEKLLQEETQQQIEKEEKKQKNKRRPKPPKKSPFPPEQKDA